MSANVSSDGLAFRRDRSGTCPRPSRMNPFRFGMRWRNKRFPMFLGLNFGRGSGKDEKPWWTGPNVCENRYKEETNQTESEIQRHFSYQSQTCDATDNTYKCTTEKVENGVNVKVTKIMECCKGFTRKEDDFGCPKEVKLKNLVETARDMGLHEFLRAVDSIGMVDELSNDVFTVFAPEDKAFGEGDEVLNEVIDIPEIRLQDQPAVLMISKPIKDTLVADMKNLILGHLVSGIHRSSSFSDEQLVETGSPVKSKIRINFYSHPTKLMTANCVKVISQDRPASNGVIHKVEALIKPVTETMMDIISKNPQLSNLKTMIGKSSLSKSLRGDGQFTLFAPTNNAFKMLDDYVRDRLLYGNKCVDEVIKNHILQNVICSTVIQGEARSRNLLNKYLNLTRDDDDKLFVEGTQVVDKDIMATNGVMYVVDELLLPEEALDVIDVAMKQGASKFVRLLSSAGLTNEMVKTENVTLFAPSDDAFKNLSDDALDSLEGDPEALRKLITYHVASSDVSCDKMRNNGLLDTMGMGGKLRYNEYSTWPFGRKAVQTIQCARITQKDVEACNGRVNIIDKFIMLPSGTAIDILGGDKRFSTFVSLLKKSGLADELQKEGSFTVFAPTNEAFDKIGEKTMKRLQEDPEKMKSFLQNHIAEDVLCCSGVFKANWLSSQKIWAQSGDSMGLDRNMDGTPTVAGAKLSTCDLMATNGVVHAIDEVLLGKHKKGDRWDSWDDWFDDDDWSEFEDFDHHFDF